MKKVVLRIFPNHLSTFIKAKSKLNELIRHYNLIFYASLTKKPIITVFGCCRQDSISKIFLETSIKESLSYPHSTKEVLQVLDYLNDESNILNQPFAFRTPQISGRLPNRRHLAREWSATTVVVIEISSQKYYSLNGIHFHHEAFDNSTQLSKNAQDYFKSQQLDGNSLRENHMEIDELLQDLEEIVARIGKRTIILTTNFVTRNNGKRHQLHNLLEEFAKRRKIKFVETKTLFDYWKIQDFLVEEPVLAHLTDLGHQIMSGRYKEAIRSSLDKSSNKFVFKYKSYARKEMIFGLGDYLYGVMHVAQLVNRNKSRKSLLVDYSESSIAPYLVRQESITTEEPRFLFHDAEDTQLLREQILFTNKRPKLLLTPEERDFVLRSAIPLNESMSDKLISLFKALNVSKGNYTCIHVRLGDSEMLGTQLSESEEFEITRDKVERIVGNFDSGRKYLIMSDSIRLRQMLKTSGMNVLPGSAAHTGFGDVQGEGLEQTLLEFYLLLHSEKIIQISKHSWGSGFSETASILGGVPINKIQ